MPQLRTQIAGLIVHMVGRTDADLAAYAVMPNHLHLILRQGQGELSSVMQPLLRRVAYRVQKHHGFRGTVVERRYRDRPCLSAHHAREAILYTHLNPWRADLCSTDLAYPWTSHGAYGPGADPAAFGIDPRFQHRLLELFALDDDKPRDQLCLDYRWWTEWRMSQDLARAAVGDARDSSLRSPRPTTSAAERAWRRHFAMPIDYDVRTPPDLRDLVQTQLARLAPGCSIEELRGSWLPRRLARIRIRLIQAVVAAGHRTGDIARFLHVSPATVSRAKHSPPMGPTS